MNSRDLQTMRLIIVSSGWEVSMPQMCTFVTSFVSHNILAKAQFITLDFQLKLKGLKWFSQAESDWARVWICSALDSECELFTFTTFCLFLAAVSILNKSFLIVLYLDYTSQLEIFTQNNNSVTKTWVLSAFAFKISYRDIIRL